MSLHFFAIPALLPQAAQDEFNAFCAAHRVVQVERQLVVAGAQSFWALCATVATGPGPLPDALKRGARQADALGDAGSAERKVDYKEQLSAADFAVFAALRALSKTLAEQEGVPLYAVFSNQQLAVIARQRCASLADLAAVEGVAPARAQRRGIAFCGFRVRRGVVLPGARKQRRFRQGARAWMQAFHEPGTAEGDPQRAHEVLRATLARTRSVEFRRRVWARAGGYSEPL